MSNNKSITAKTGEDLASEYLDKQGYKLLHRNWRYSRIGEIDIIAQTDNTLVFVEVKTRTSNHCGDPLESITATKRNQIFKLAEIYLSENPQTNNITFRFDAIGIVLRKPPEINHLENAISFDF